MNHAHLLGFAIFTMLTTFQTMADDNQTPYDLSDLLGTKYIELSPTLHPVVKKGVDFLDTGSAPSDGSEFVVNSNSNANLKYRLAVNVKGDGTTIMEGKQIPDGEVHSGNVSNFDLRVTRLAPDKSLASFTQCASSHADGILTSSRTQHSCVTITPQVCDRIREAARGHDFQDLAARSKMCSDVAERLRDKMKGVIDSKVYQQQEAQNLDSLKKFSQGLSPTSTLAGFLSGDEYAGAKPTARQKDSGQQVGTESTIGALAFFSHLQRMASACDQKQEHFPKGGSPDAPAAATAVRQ